MDSSENSGKLTLFPYGRLNVEDGQLQERLTALLVYGKSDQQRWIENPGLSLESFLSYIGRLPQLATFFRDCLVVLTKSSPMDVQQARERLTQLYPDLSLARWIVCHLGPDARELHEFGAVEGEMDDLPLWRVRGGATYVLFTPSYRPTSATPIRLQRLEGQISSGSLAMPAVRYEDARTQSGRRLAAVILPPDSSRENPNKKP